MRLEAGVFAGVVADGDVADDAALVDDDERRKAHDAVRSRRLRVLVDSHAVTHGHALREQCDLSSIFG